MVPNSFPQHATNTDAFNLSQPSVRATDSNHRNLGGLIGSVATSTLLTLSITALSLVMESGKNAHAGLCAVGRVREVGTWMNPDANTRGITRAIFAEECRDNSRRVCNGNICTITHGVKLVYTARLWGQCHPRDCYWGKVDGVYTSTNWLSFNYDHGFAKRKVWGQIRSDDRLRLIIDTDFSSPSRRDYRFTALMRRR